MTNHTFCKCERNNLRGRGRGVEPKEGGSIILWRCFSATGSGNFVKVKEIVNCQNLQQNWMLVIICSYNVTMT